jgi:hypothetical protein
MQNTKKKATNAKSDDKNRKSEALIGADFIQLYNEELKRRQEAYSVFIDSDDENIEIPKPDIFIILWTEFSAWVTGHTLKFYKPSSSVASSETTVTYSSDDKLKEIRELELFCDMFNELNMKEQKQSLEEEIKEKKKIARQNIYSLDPIIRGEQQEQRFEVLLQGINQHLIRICSELYLSAAQTLDLANQLLNTFSYNQRLSSFNINEWKCVALIIAKSFLLHKADVIRTKSTPSTEKAIRYIDSRLTALGLSRSQIGLLDEVLIHGVY